MAQSKDRKKMETKMPSFSPPFSQFVGPSKESVFSAKTAFEYLLHAHREDKIKAIKLRPSDQSPIPSQAL
jgi:hypothetical protein